MQISPHCDVDMWGRIWMSCFNSVWQSLNFDKEYLFGFETLVFATSGILSIHNPLVTLQRESKTWNFIWPLECLSVLQKWWRAGGGSKNRRSWQPFWVPSTPEAFVRKCSTSTSPNTWSLCVRCARGPSQVRSSSTYRVTAGFAWWQHV